MFILSIKAEDCVGDGSGKYVVWRRNGKDEWGSVKKVGYKAMNIVEDEQSS
jgi:hypothetical protein